MGDQNDEGQSMIGEAEDSLTTEFAPVFDQVLPRFPVARHGYDCAAVDEYVAELEQELAELDGELVALRDAAPLTSETAAEIERLGKQTSGILLAAHDGAQEIARLAQEQADRCISDAAANALAITTEANQRVSELQNQIASLGRERNQILNDVRQAADALSSIAGDPPESLLPEPVRAS
ncbi:MAG: DivIVA domain-containing protein [Solirubrobacteraceae bacterium]